MTPLEAAARAAYRKDHGFENMTDADVGDLWRQNYLPIARAVIEALRDPTPAMVAAGERETTPAGCWAAMIDALLTETPAGQARQARQAPDASDPARSHPP